MDQTIVLYIYFGGIPVLVFLAGMFPEALENDDGRISLGWFFALIAWPLVVAAPVIVGMMVGVIVGVPLLIAMVVLGTVEAIVAVFGLIFSLGGMVRKRLLPF